MTKEKLLQLLSVLPDDSVIQARYKYNKPYSAAYSAAIKGVNFVLGSDDTVSVTLCAKEIKDNTVDDGVPF